jgi:exodeoxyribonuclease VII large subunit
MAVPDKKDMDRYIKALTSRLYSAVNEKAAGYRQRFNACLAGRVFTRPVDVICGTRQQTLDFLNHRLKQGITALAGREEKRLAVLAGRLQALSPLATLARGYSICTTPDGKHVISEAGRIEIGERLAVRLQKGILDCIVEGRSS